MRGYPIRITVQDGPAGQWREPDAADGVTAVLAALADPASLDRIEPGDKARIRAALTAAGEALDRYPGGERPEPDGVLLTGEQIACWARLGRALSAGELAALDEAIPESSIPGSIEEIISGALGITAESEPS